MPLTEPVPFREALSTVAKKMPKGAPWRSDRWAQEETAVRERAFFSATIESIRFLQRARDFILDFLSRTTKSTPGGIALKADGRSRFVRDMAQFAIREGLGPVGIPASRVDPNDITDIRSEARLRLIFDTQVKQAFGYGYYKQGQDPVILDAFPAARFVRHPGAKEFRPRHQAATGDVRLKSDRSYWLYQNAREIGGFETVYPPYGFNSRMDQEDVGRQEAQELGLIQEGERAEPVKTELNDRLKASLSGIDDDLRQRLADELGAKIGKSSTVVRHTKASVKRRVESMQKPLLAA